MYEVVSVVRPNQPVLGMVLIVKITHIHSSQLRCLNQACFRVLDGLSLDYGSSSSTGLNLYIIYHSSYLDVFLLAEEQPGATDCQCLRPALDSEVAVLTVRSVSDCGYLFCQL